MQLVLQVYFVLRLLYLTVEPSGYSQQKDSLVLSPSAVNTANPQGDTSFYLLLLCYGLEKENSFHRILLDCEADL